MGKSLSGGELGRGITQRKDGRYQARFVNRFGKRDTVYGKTINEVRQKLKIAKNENIRRINVVDKNMTLREWYDVWATTCKKHCRESTMDNYWIRYKRIDKDLGWRKLKELNLICMQDALNGLRSDNARNETKKVLNDMLSRALDMELIVKNPTPQLVAFIDGDDKKERRVLTKEETKIFMEYAEGTFYYDLYVLLLETGMRIGEALGIIDDTDIDFKKKSIYLSRTLCYFRKEGKYTHEFHQTKTKNGKRTIPLTTRAMQAVFNQRSRREEIRTKGIKPKEGFEGLLFVTRTNSPSQYFIVQECINVTIEKIRRAGIEFEGFSPHAFRHTFATRAIENGMQPKTLSRILGHASVKTTMDLYCHVTEETLQDAMQLMEKTG